MQTLYKYDSLGKSRFWAVEVDQSTGRWRSLSGVVDSPNTVTSEWAQAVGKNAGKANATTDAEQAFKEALAAWSKKTKEGYAEDIEASGVTFVEPMLAQKFKDKALKDVPYILVQPKFDGIRCITTIRGMFTRTGEPIVSCPHIMEAVAPLFKVYPDLVLDGELYNHDFREDFNSISSIVRKETPTDERIVQARELMHYYVYDGFFMENPDVLFFNRYGLITNHIISLETNSVKTVLTRKIMTGQYSTLPELHGEFVDEGYEGIMIRKDDLYEVGKRSWSLMKYKSFIDDEFLIQRIEKRRGHSVVIICALPDGREFGATLKGSKKFKEQVLAEAEEYTSKEATVEFFNYTPDGIPRFGVAAKLYKDGKI
jgi:ATP-dependent DNA ligase